MRKLLISQFNELVSVISEGSSVMSEETVLFHMISTKAVHTARQHFLRRVLQSLCSWLGHWREIEEEKNNCICRVSDGRFSADANKS